MKYGRFWFIGGLLMMVLLMVGCPAGGNPTAQDQAQRKAAHNQVYIPKNNIELDNYNDRQRIADDPSTILWCTSAFPIPSSPLFTFPIVGKLTSGQKRPFSTSVAEVGYNGDTYSPERPGPDGMYGASGDYRYGFTPDGQYVDFYDISTFCTTVPTIWARERTTIVLGTDAALLSAQREAQACLKNGDHKCAAAALAKGLSK